MTGLQGAEAVFIKATFYYWAKYEKLDWLEDVAFLFEWNYTKKKLRVLLGHLPCKILDAITTDAETQFLLCFFIKYCSPLCLLKPQLFARAVHKVTANCCCTFKSTLIKHFVIFL